MGTPLVMSVSPCRACTDRVKDGEWEWGRCTTPSEANATLIATAPELLESLKAMVAILPEGMDEPGSVVAKAIAIIAKAEGRS